jgi:glyoxylase-like metal-dependent hydrolase (beta-lactamase superfamily II)
MIIHNTGKIIEDLYTIYSPDLPVYLLDGEKPAIFDAGFSFLGQKYVEEIKKVLGTREPYYCFLSHSHFDHCGAVAILKENFPSMKIVASRKAKETLGRPNAISLIEKLSRESECMAEKFGLKEIPPDSFKPFAVDITVSEGDILRISDDVTVRVIETPGHTRDFLTFYIPEKKVLLPSEAVGLPDENGHIHTMFLVDYDMYLNSIKKLCTLDTDVICFGHYLVYTDDDARYYLEDSISQCDSFLKLIKRFLVEENGDPARVRDRIKSIEYDGKTGIVQPEPAYLLNLEASINVVIKRIERGACI